MIRVYKNNLLIRSQKSVLALNFPITFEKILSVKQVKGNNAAVSRIIVEYITYMRCCAKKDVTLKM